MLIQQLNVANIIEPHKMTMNHAATSNRMRNDHKNKIEKSVKVQYNDTQEALPRSVHTIQTHKTL